MKNPILVGAVVLLLMILSACSPKETQHSKPVELTISAAASLNDALMEIQQIFEKENPQIKLLFNIGGTGALKQQIVQGAPVDLFLSAAVDPFNELIQKGYIDQQSKVDLLGNKLVLVTNKEKPANISGFSDLKLGNINKMAIGIPQSVPAGKYAKQTLENLGLWEDLYPLVIQTKDVRQALTYVETGNVDAGIVYMSDVYVSDKVKVVATADEQNHEPIIYPAGIIKSSSKKKEAEVFLSYLQGKKAKTIFEKYGFIVLD